MKYLLTLGCALLTLTACASSRITASITVTNSTTNGVTFTVNGIVRTFTNNVVTSSSQVLTNSDVTGCGSKTNLFNQIALNPFAGLALIDTGSNTFQLVGTCGGSLLVTLSAGYATTNMSAQTCSAATPVGVPFSAYYPNVNSRTNTGSQLASDLNSYSTNSLDENAPIGSEFVGMNNPQTITGQKTFSNTNGIWEGIISQIVTEANFLIGGYWTNAVLDEPSLTNAVNYGNAFSSPGAGGPSEQFGIGSTASGQFSVAAGYGASASALASASFGDQSLATNTFSTAIGAQAHAYGGGATAVGEQSVATAGASSAFGQNANASGISATAIGVSSAASFQNSTALGFQSTTTASNQVMLGAPGISAVVQNNLIVQTNLIVGGSASVGGNFTVAGIQSNAFVTGSLTLSNAGIAFVRKAITTIANGNNAAIPVGPTNAFVEFSGNSAAVAYNGFAGGQNGTFLIGLNQSGFPVTLANESGVDPTPANRIRTMSGADLTLPGSSTFMCIYNANVSRWILLSAGTVVTVTNVNASQITGGIQSSQIYTPVTQTNFVLNQIYTNLTGGGIGVHALSSLTTAAVAGSSEMDLMAAQTGSTFTLIDSAKLITSVSAVTGSSQFGLNGSVTTNGMYYFTNSSAGAGDSSTLVSGSGQVTGL